MASCHPQGIEIFPRHRTQKHKTDRVTCLHLVSRNRFQNCFLQLFNIEVSEVREITSQNTRPILYKEDRWLWFLSELSCDLQPSTATNHKKQSTPRPQWAAYEAHSSLGKNHIGVSIGWDIEKPRTASKRQPIQEYCLSRLDSYAWSNKWESQKPLQLLRVSVKSPSSSRLFLTWHSSTAKSKMLNGVRLTSYNRLTKLNTQANQKSLELSLRPKESMPLRNQTIQSMLWKQFVFESIMNTFAFL